MTEWTGAAPVGGGGPNNAPGRATRNWSSGGRPAGRQRTNSLAIGDHGGARNKTRAAQGHRRSDVHRGRPTHSLTPARRWRLRLIADSYGPAREPIQRRPAGAQPLPRALRAPADTPPGPGNWAVASARSTMQLNFQWAQPGSPASSPRSGYPRPTLASRSSLKNLWISR